MPAECPTCGDTRDLEVESLYDDLDRITKERDRWIALYQRTDAKLAQVLELWGQLSDDVR